MSPRSRRLPNSTRMKALRWSVPIMLLGWVVGPASSQEPGQTPRPKPEEPLRQPTDEELVRLDKQMPEWSSVKDDAPFVYAGKRAMDAIRMRQAIEEEKAYNYVLAFASRQPLERLQRTSIKDVPLENLYHDIRRDYLRELIHLEGNLTLVTKMKATDDLRELSGIEHLYEAWVFVRGPDKPHLVCAVVSELPEGVTPGENQNLRVAFDAYYFKLWHYESRKVKDPEKDPEKREWQRAPLFLGKTFVVKGPVTAPDTYTPTMLYGVIGALTALTLAAVGIAVYFRRGDRHIRSAARHKIENSVRFENLPEPPAGPANRISDQF